MEKETLMSIGWKSAALAFGLAAAVAMSIPNAASAAALAGGSGLKAATDALPGNITDVRWRGRYVGPAIVGGLAAGIIGAAAANAYGPRYYYSEPHYYYDGPYAYDAPRYYYHARPRGRERYKYDF